MDTLPDHLIINILTRLNDSIELAQCKLVCRTLNTLARQVRSIHLHCSLDRFSKMRSPETSFRVTPFKNIFVKLISDTQVPIESVSLGVEEDESLRRYRNYDHSYEVRSHDLLLTAGPFSGYWMTKIGDRLKSVSISDCQVQSRDKVCNILEVLSYNCHSLVELTLKNACLYVDDMHLMPLLTKLTLKYATIFDESLNKLMECLPCLQVLNLIDSGGVTDPKIHHLNLKELNWTLYANDESYYLSTVSIFAPNLTKLELQFVYRIRLSIHAPFLSYCNLALSVADLFKVEKFKTLKTLHLVSWDLHNILSTIPTSVTVQNLTFNTPKSEDEPYPPDKIEFTDVFTIFPNVTSLTLGYEIWSQLMLYPSEPLAHVAKGLRPRLKEFTAYLELVDIDKTFSFILYIVGICSKLTDIVLFIHRRVDLGVAISFVSSCMSQCPKVRFRWGIWSERTEDRFISNCIVSAMNTV